MPPLNADNIDITGISSVSTSRVRLRRLTSGSTEVSYDVVFNIYSTGYDDVTSAYNAFTSSLNSAVTSGSFTSYLQEYASDNGVSDLTSASASSVEFTEPVQVSGGDDSEESNSNDSVSNGLIIGLVVGVVGSMACLAYVGHFILYSEGSGTAHEHGRDQEHEHVVHRTTPNPSSVPPPRRYDSAATAAPSAAPKRPLPSSVSTSRPTAAATSSGAAAAYSSSASAAGRETFTTSRGVGGGGAASMGRTGTSSTARDNRDTAAGASRYDAGGRTGAGGGGGGYGGSGGNSNSSNSRSVRGAASTGSSLSSPSAYQYPGGASSPPPFQYKNPSSGTSRAVSTFSPREARL